MIDVVSSVTAGSAGVYAASVNWEYTTISSDTTTPAGVTRWTYELNAHGSLGWEVVGLAAVDPTIGVNCYTAILKRQAVALDAPVEVAAGWNPDPARRFELRYWDGLRWTQHVSTGGEAESDFPNVR